jgi:replication factor C subunit 1
MENMNNFTNNFTDNILWINKYKPSNISEIISNKEEINMFNKWLDQINNNKNMGIIISGEYGIGKTLTARLILEEKGYLVRVITSNELKDHRIYDDFNDYYSFNNSIYSKLSFFNKNNKKIALIFDEIENITLSSEKKYIIEIYKDNNKYRSFPLVFITNNRHSKLLYDLKKCCKEIIFLKPKYEEMESLAIKICKNEKLYVESYNEIIEFSQYDIRRFINLLQELKYHSTNNIIKNEQIHEFINKSKKKNIDIGLFDATYKIINNYLDYETAIRLYESEKVLLPLMIHESYTKKILYDSCSFNDALNRMIIVSDSISKADNVETSIYTDQYWYLQNIHGFYSCINTSYWINKNNKYVLPQDDIKFSGDLNKTSLKNINKKNINNLLKIIHKKQIEEILILNRICNNLIKEKKENILINILNNYKKNISIKDIELCLKIDKTIEFNVLNSKDKKIITKYIKGL